MTKGSAMLITALALFVASTVILAGWVTPGQPERAAWARHGLVGLVMSLWLPPAIAAAVFLAGDRRQTPPSSNAAADDAARQREAMLLEARRIGRVRGVLDASESMEMHLQPIVRLDDRVVIGYEALARFADPEGRGPDFWFAEAREMGMGFELEMVALQRGLVHLSALPDDAYLSINLSAETLRRPEVREVLRDVPPGRLVLELTEHEVVNDYERLNADLLQLADAGIRLAVDDAGAGFASLRHIIRLSPAIIKLDRSLVDEINDDPRRLSLAASLVAFAIDAGATIVAEGVERAVDLDALTTLGVGCAQGYLLARPAPAAKVLGAARGSG